MEHYGLTMKEVDELQLRYGKNEIRKKQQWSKKILRVISEPIYSLLLIAAFLYFLMGEALDGAIMMVFVLFVIGIDVLQDIRTGHTLKKLKEISEPLISVIREGIEQQVPGKELVPGDILILREGVKVPVDGYLIEANGLCVDESILTGEAQGVWKVSSNLGWQKEEPLLQSLLQIQTKVNRELDRKDYCYAGTLVILGTGLLLAENTGNNTEYGKIADVIENIPWEHSLLQRKMKGLARQCTGLAFVLFLLVGIATYFNLSYVTGTERLIRSGLAGIVLALSMIPGEFPVILSVFFSMGALRLARKKALIRHLPVVETIGSISVLCMDKTGTITQNRMRVTDCYIVDRKEERFCKILTLACKEGAYDPLEAAILEYKEQLCRQDSNKDASCFFCQSKVSCSKGEEKPKLLREYTFTNELKAMAQVWLEDGKRTLAAKGSPETIMSLCYLPGDIQKLVEGKLLEYAEKGLRVIAVADRILNAEEALPDSLSECHLFFRGLVGLYDPPREDIQDQIKACYEAGIRIIMITGDHPVTASAIAREVGIKNHSLVITGDEIIKLTEEELKQRVRECNLYARVLPLHKMRIVKALKDNGEITAMVGDGVNDSPAQRIADIGIAMGKHGSEVCREAADLILLDDNFHTILEAIRDGRRIFYNLRKAIAYIFSIHVPIALISLLGPLLHIEPEALMLLPLHIVLLELVMDPTCSVALERLPAEDHIMGIPPRHPSDHLLTLRALLRAIFQGVIIFIAAFGIYYLVLSNNSEAELARTMGFAVLVFANILLVPVNCTNQESILHILLKMSRDKGIWIVNLSILIGLGIMIYSPLNQSLGFVPLRYINLFKAAFISCLAVIWYEGIKFLLKIKQSH